MTATNPIPVDLLALAKIAVESRYIVIYSTEETLTGDAEYDVSFTKYQLAKDVFNLIMKNW